jgi:hypothetical protein
MLNQTIWWNQADKLMNKVEDENPKMRLRMDAYGVTTDTALLSDSK